MINPVLDADRKLRNGWWILVFFAVLAALVVPATILAPARQATVGPASQAALVAIATAICLALRRQPPATLLGSARSWRRGVPAGIGLGVATWTVAAGVLWTTGSVSWQVNPDAFAALGAGLGTGLAIAVAEELVFRGFVFQRLVAGIGAWPAQLAMAGYFLLNHWNNPGMHGATQVIAAINIFVAGLLFGALYLRTRSLAVPIALHFALNFTQGHLLGFGVSGNASHGLLVPHLGDAPAWWTGGAFGLEASVPGTVIVLIALVAVVRPRRAGIAGGDVRPRSLSIDTPTLRRTS